VEKHIQTRDKKVRNSEQDKDRQHRKRTHSLETRRQGKVSKRTGNRGKHTRPNNKKARESE
jgi:predicted nucleic acid-binding protein